MLLCHHFFSVVQIFKILGCTILMCAIWLTLCNSPRGCWPPFSNLVIQPLDESIWLTSSNHSGYLDDRLCFSDTLESWCDIHFTVIKWLISVLTGEVSDARLKELMHKFMSVIMNKEISLAQIDPSIALHVKTHEMCIHYFLEYSHPSLDPHLNLFSSIPWFECIISNCI